MDVRSCTGRGSIFFISISPRAKGDGGGTAPSLREVLNSERPQKISRRKSRFLDVSLDF